MKTLRPFDPTSAPGDTVIAKIADGQAGAAFIPTPLWDIDVDIDSAELDPKAVEKELERLNNALSGVPHDKRRKVVSNQLREAGLGPGEQRRYKTAVSEAITALKSGFGPDSLRDIHRVRVADENAVPGTFRTRQVYATDDRNRIRFVAPPAHAVKPELEAVCDYMAADSNNHPLVDIALIHYQIATVHPFLDGTGRTVRVLSDALLREYGLVAGPGLSLVPNITREKAHFHSLLLRANRTGDFAPLVGFFLQSVQQQAIQTRHAITSGGLTDAIRAAVDAML